MKKKTRDLYAPICKRAMKADQKICDYMYERIPEVIEGKKVSEIATGPGLLAKHAAHAAATVTTNPDLPELYNLFRESSSLSLPMNVRTASLSN
ncbi:MAG: hypothetical protein IJV00_09195 [Clostridia bacterium]|nr:hypothetical protein [Clostridia bacterium]